MKGQRSFQDSNIVQRFVKKEVSTKRSHLPARAIHLHFASQRLTIFDRVGRRERTDESPWSTPVTATKTRSCHDDRSEFHRHARAPHTFFASDWTLFFHRGYGCFSVPRYFASKTNSQIEGWALWSAVQRRAGFESSLLTISLAKEMFSSFLFNGTIKLG